VIAPKNVFTHSVDIAVADGTTMGGYVARPTGPGRLRRPPHRPRAVPRRGGGHGAVRAQRPRPRGLRAARHPRVRRPGPRPIPPHRTRSGAGRRRRRARTRVPTAAPTDPAAGPARRRSRHRPAARARQRSRGHGRSQRRRPRRLPSRHRVRPARRRRRLRRLAPHHRHPAVAAPSRPWPAHRRSPVACSSSSAKKTRSSHQNIGAKSPRRCARPGYATRSSPTPAWPTDSSAAGEPPTIPQPPTTPGGACRTCSPLNSWSIQTEPLPHGLSARSRIRYRTAVDGTVRRVASAIGGTT